MLYGTVYRPVDTLPDTIGAYHLAVVQAPERSLLLERLTPIERAVFVLHDVLGYDHPDVADAVGLTPAACRQALHRAREHVTLPERRTEADHAQAARVAERFLAAGLSGDVDALLATLAPDVVLTSDGGGVVHAAVRPVVSTRSGSTSVPPDPRSVSALEAETVSSVAK